MMLTITSTAPPATDLGFLLHKHPDRVHDKELSFGIARVAYPEAGEDRCTAALVVDVDPVDLVRGRRGARAGAGSLAHYVNDRPYVASSFLASAVGKMFGTALGGRCKDRPELVDQPLPLDVRVPVLPCRGGEPLLRSLFEPLDYEVEAEPVVLDAAFPEWGESPYLDVRLVTTARLRDVLAHLVVLLPVLDDAKHHWVDQSEIDRLLLRGGDWLPGHPRRDLITRRYLRHDRQLTSDALARLLEADDAVVDQDTAEESRNASEATLERPVRLNDQRMVTVVTALRDLGVASIADLGCGEGTLLRALLKEHWVDRVVGLDVSWRSLEIAARRLGLDEMTPRQRSRVDLWQGALTYRDRRLRGFDALALVEVIEHIDLGRLSALEDAVFGDARPRAVVVTTPNVEYNARFESLPADRFRHPDHRFEWTRAEFAAWARGVAQRHDFRVVFTAIGPVDDEVGSPTQMAVFSR